MTSATAASPSGGKCTALAMVPTPMFPIWPAAICPASRRRMLEAASMMTEKRVGLLSSSLSGMAYISCMVSASRS
eukprot:scaffold3499_cov117-Isochrysis_galbana.AAC.15